MRPLAAPCSPLADFLSPFPPLASHPAQLVRPAEVYLDAVDFVSISVALYGLIVFYSLVKERLAGKKPLAKFLSIKIVVMLLFYQFVPPPCSWWTMLNLRARLAGASSSPSSRATA